MLLFQDQQVRCLIITMITNTCLDVVNLDHSSQPTVHMVCLIETVNTQKNILAVDLMSDGNVFLVQGQKIATRIEGTLISKMVTTTLWTNPLCLLITTVLIKHMLPIVVNHQFLSMAKVINEHQLPLTIVEKLLHLVQDMVFNVLYILIIM